MSVPSVGTIVRYRYSTESWLAAVVVATDGSADVSWYNEDGDEPAPSDSNHVNIFLFAPTGSTNFVANVTEGYAVGQFLVAQ